MGLILKLFSLRSPLCGYLELDRAPAAAHEEDVALGNRAEVAFYVGLAVAEVGLEESLLNKSHAVLEPVARKFRAWIEMLDNRA